MTYKLYYEDSHIKEFEATVISCEKKENTYELVLDKTAFFPEGGGQPGDTGWMDGIEVLDTQESGDTVIHYIASEIQADSVVKCRIDWDKRFGRMQNHSGEHVVSGIIHGMTGFNNVGFHMGEDCVTIDFDGEISQEQLAEIEKRANKAIADNIRIEAFIPSKEELNNIDYRSKKELLGDVRIVKIEGIDICACCAPHVYTTGEIELVKFISSMRHRGGTRIEMLSGKNAYDDYVSKHDSVVGISRLLSAKTDEVVEAVERIMREKEELKQQNYSLCKSVVNMYIEKYKNVSEGNIVIFEACLSDNHVRDIINELVKSCPGIVGVFAGNDEAGYKYVIGSSNIDLRKNGQMINSAIDGRGGGSPTMIQGNSKCTLTKITNFFETATIWT